MGLAASGRFRSVVSAPVQITAAGAGRVDKELARHSPDAGRPQLAELFDDGCVRVAGKRAKKGDRVAPGDVIERTRTPKVVSSAEHAVEAA
jgi:ribosomal 50S subunit-recycling heat shock protein